MQHKYIVFDGREAVCFPGSMMHSGLSFIDKTHSVHLKKLPTSAGFFELGTEETCDYHGIRQKDKITVTVFGESESLKLKSKPTDAGLLAIALGIVQC